MRYSQPREVHQARVGNLGAGEVYLYNLRLFVLAHATAECLHQRLQRRRRRRFLLCRDRRTERHSGNGDNDQTCAVMGHNVSSLARSGVDDASDQKWRVYIPDEYI